MDWVIDREDRWAGQAEKRHPADFLTFRKVVEGWAHSSPPGSHSKMQIFGPFRVSTAVPTTGAQRLQPQKPVDSTAAPRSASPVDKLDISNHVNRLEPTASTSTSDIRVDRVADLRRQIASGNYETPEKMDAALSRFLDDFA